MRTFYLLTALAFVGCSSGGGGSGGTPAANTVNDQIKKTGAGTPEQKGSVVRSGDEQKSGTVKKSGPSAGGKAATLAGCANGATADSDHVLTLTTDKGTGRYVVDFAKADDRSLRVVSLYVTGKDDSIPIFPKFEFKGTSYWMVSLDKPFETYFTLPVEYQNLPSPGVDVTANYHGPAGGADLNALAAPTCLKFTVITFEESREPAFRTSTYMQGQKP